MNGLVLIAAFAIGVLSGSFLLSLFERHRRHWSTQRQQWTAAFALPAVILIATVAGTAWVATSGPGSGENMQDLAVVATAAVGALFGIVALFGGIVGVRVAKDRKKS
jgi:hypothetical protein